MDVNIGVLAIQGSFLEHECALLKCLKENGGVLEGLNLHIHRVTQASDVSCLDGLVIPGGESSVISQILSDELLEELNSWLNDEKHVLFGTCAGLIVLSKGLENAIEGQITRLSKLARLDIMSSRNYFGRQLNSFEGQVQIKEKAVSQHSSKNGVVALDECNSVFIRAPAVLSIHSPAVKTLATLQVDEKELIVGVEQKNCIGLAFHPELTNDIRWHVYFLNMILERKSMK